MDKGTLEQLGVHMSYLRDDVAEIKTVIKEMRETSPTKEEVAKVEGEVKALSDDVDVLKGDRKYVLGAASLIVLLWGAMAMFANLYVDKAVRDILAEYEVTIK